MPLSVTFSRLKAYPLVFYFYRLSNYHLGNVSILVNIFQPSDAFHIETSHLIRKTDQMTGFYMKYKNGRTWVQWIYFSNRTVYLDGKKSHLLFTDSGKSWSIMLFITIQQILSVIRQMGESENEYFKKTNTSNEHFLPPDKHTLSAFFF